MKRSSPHRGYLTRVLWLTLLLLWSGISVAAQEGPGEPDYDLVIRNGRVLDGAGSPWIRADVAIQEGRFVKIGRVEGRGHREIDASGKYVAPGFIDMMDQSGAALLSSGAAENKLRMGVTTAIAGEGGTPGMTPEGELADRPGRAYEVDAFFATLEESGISINFGSYFSQTQARWAVLGMENRPPTDDELTEMKQLMDAAMKGGALGMTTALIYPPSSYATTDELVSVARVAAEHGGIYASHIRDEGKGLVEAVEEAIEIGERAEIPVEIFHLKAAYQPGWGTLMREAIQEIDAARVREVEVAANIYPYTAGGTGLEATIPAWAHEGGRDSLLARLSDSETRDRLKRDVEEGSPGWWNIIEASGGWENIILVNARNDENARYENKSLAEIAEEQGKDPVDAAWDLVMEGEGRVMAIYHMMGEEDIETALRQPWVSIGSDAGAAITPGTPDELGLPHPRSYGTFPRVLAHYVRERSVLTLPEAIHRMTGWPATRMRLPERGLVKEGFWADVVIFDFEKIQDRATYEEPTRFPEGISHVVVNGQLVIEDAEHTGRRPGQVLYGPGVQEATGSP